MRRYLRYLRIGWTAACVIACVLLIALWVRSYSWNEVFHFFSGGKRYHAQSLCGRIVVGRSELSRSELNKGQARKLISYRQPVTDRLRQIAHNGENVLGFDYCHSLPPELISITIPDWFLIAAFATVATLPWLRWRFSLRTLLLAMTLIALLLGMIVALGR